MKSQKLYFIIVYLVALAACAVLAWLPCHADDTVFGDFEKGLVPAAEQADQACCDRGIYSKSFDSWLKNYINGKSAEADKDWAGVLKAAKGARSLNKLASSANTRLEFVEGEDSAKLEKLGGPLSGIKALYASTQHLLGESEQLATIAEYIANQYKNSHAFQANISWLKKALSTREHVWGHNDARVSSTLSFLADGEYLARDYAASKAHAEQALAIATACHALKAQMQGRASCWPGCQK